MIFRVVASTISECKERHVRESKIVDSRSVNVSMVDQHVSMTVEVAMAAVDMMIQVALAMARFSSWERRWMEEEREYNWGVIYI